MTQALDAAAGPARAGVCTLDLQGMHCASCVGRIERSLKKVAGVEDAAVNLATNRARVLYDPALATPASLIAAVEKSGYAAAPVADARLAEADAARRDGDLLNLVGAAVLTLPVLLLSMTGMGMAGMGRPFWTEWLFAALTAVVVFGFGRQFFAGAWNALRHGGVATMDTLVAVGASASYFYSLAALIYAARPQVYFETAATIVTLILLGRRLEAGAKRRSTRSARRSLASGSNVGRRSSACLRIADFCCAIVMRGTEPPKPLASHPPEPACAGGNQIPRPGSRQRQPPRGCLSAPGMNCLTHPAAPPSQSRSARAPAQSPRPGRPSGTGAGGHLPRPAAGGPVRAAGWRASSACRAARRP